MSTGKSQVTKNKALPRQCKEDTKDEKQTDISNYFMYDDIVWQRL
jgi:hypothetical protein